MHRFIIIILFLLLLFSNGTAQEPDGHPGLGIYIGPQKLVGGNADAAMIGGWAGFNLFYGISNRLIIDVNIARGWSSIRDPNNQIKKISKGPELFFRTWLLPVHANLTYLFKEDGSFRPYLTAGAGVLFWQLRYERWVSDFFTPSGRNVYGNQSNALANIGLGTMIALSDHWLLDFSARYNHLFDQNLDNIGTGYDAVTAQGDPFGGYIKKREGDVNTGILEFRVGLKFLFGGAKDSDGDGIVDKNDNCRDLPEDYDGFQDMDGCPDPDNDQDGIQDNRDKCPNQPEDIDGFQDEDGCPDLDNDGDGIPDLEDQCPNQAEDMDGFEDEDGCPDLDNDGDGIPDLEDQCPDQPETVNNYQDEDGCPDEAPQKPAMEKGVSLIFPDVTFLSGSSELTTQAKLTLDNVSKMLTGHPEIRVEIRGYTDNTGSAASNLNLSQKRAVSVKRYLVNLGVDSDRMVAIGFGEETPIATNSTAEGRAKNRRIEFVRIE